MNATHVGKIPLGFPHPEFDAPGNYYYNLQYDESFDILNNLVIDWDRFPGSDHFGHGNDHFQLESQLTILSRVCGGSE